MNCRWQIRGLARLLTKLANRTSAMVWPFLLFLGLSQVACKPQGSRNATQNDHPTRLETCLNQMKGDTNQALEGFLNLDLAQGQLFSKGNPLSYSEAEFAKLD